jgi:ADP-heptose:LPS heptosyltransferase
MQFDLAINAVYSMDYRHLDCLVGWTHAPRRIAHQCLDRHAKRERRFPYFTELVPSEQEWKFEIDRNLDMLKYLGFAGPESHKSEVWITEEDRAQPLAFREDLKGEPYAVLVPGSREKNKIWDADNFISVIKEVQKHSHIAWIIAGSKDEKERCIYIAERLSSSFARVHNTAGSTTLRELSAIIAGATLLLANDTGPVHIAAAVGTSTVCVLGGWSYGRFYPYPGNPLTMAVTNKLPCFNCHMHCILDEEECITKISTTDVVDAVIRLLSQQSKSGTLFLNSQSIHNSGVH